MKITTFRSMTESGLNKKVNNFLENQTIEIIDVKFSITIFDYGVMILYKKKEQ
ncbi:hypothetical protein [Rossellomorea aquimaris]|uniref:hypothetical protein n=1 Tax=Rossellomorea aquimaris TaxID=189382 RepID=UPI001653B81D|nr:hypothetical protein [Rossellomorea aquimaris]